MVQKSIILSLLVLGTSVGCGGGPAETASFRSHAGGAAGAGSGGSGGTISAGGAGSASNAGGASSAGGSAAASNPNALRFDNVHCMHEAVGLTSIVDDSPIECRFDVLGDPSRQVTLRCEDEKGQPVECGSMSLAAQIQPFGPQPIPLSNASFWDWPTGMVGKDYSVVMVAEDGVEVVEYPLTIPIIADDKINVPPTIDFDCAGDSDGYVSVKAGDTVKCHVTFRDADPWTFDYSMQRTQGVDPVNYVATESGGTYYIRELDLVWSTDISEAGTSATYELTANDYVAPIPKKSIVIDVQ